MKLLQESPEDLGPGFGLELVNPNPGVGLGLANLGVGLGFANPGAGAGLWGRVRVRFRVRVTVRFRVDPGAVKFSSSRSVCEVDYCLLSCIQPGAPPTGRCRCSG